MPNLAYPFDNAPWPAERYYRDAPLWAPSGVVGTSAATASTSGALALSFSVTDSVITVNMAVGRARVLGTLFERKDAPWTSGMAGDQPHDGSAAYPLNTNSQPRIDRLVIRRDLAAGTAYPIILQGTPAASPVAPALSQVDTGVWDLALFQWRLAGSSSTTVSNIVDERRWISATSGMELPGVPVTSTATLTPATGFTPTSLILQSLGNGRAYIQLQATYTGATVTANVYGEITDQLIATLPPGWAPLNISPTGSMFRVAGFAILEDGRVTLRHLGPGRDLVQNDVVGLWGDYRLATP